MSESYYYEMLLAQYSSREGAIELLRQYRPYLELIPSLRRPEHSLLTIPLPLVRIRQSSSLFTRETTRLPCDLAILMCDPEWKVKLGAEILVFIHRAGEDFSDLLKRWRETQIYLDRDYEWLMPSREQHLFSEKAEEVHPLFVVLDKTPDHIKRGLLGADLPMVIQTPTVMLAEESVQLVDRDS